MKRGEHGYQEVVGNGSGTGGWTGGFHLFPFILAVILCFSCLTVLRMSCLVVRNRAGTVTAAFRLQGELAFSLRYIHSVALLPCEEFLTALPDGRIRVDGTSFSGLGAGLPFGTEGADFKMENGAVTLNGLDRYHTEITLLPSPFKDHTLSIGLKVFNLRALAGEHGTCTFSIEKIPLLLIPGVVAACANL